MGEREFVQKGSEQHTSDPAIEILERISSGGVCRRSS